MSQTTDTDVELLTLQELAMQARVPVSWLYERSRHDALPGQRRVGKYVRVDRAEFFAALSEGRVK